MNGQAMVKDHGTLKNYDKNVKNTSQTVSAYLANFIFFLPLGYCTDSFVCKNFEKASGLAANLSGPNSFRDPHPKASQSWPSDILVKVMAEAKPRPADWCCGVNSCSTQTS